MSPQDAEDFIRRHARPVAHPLVPEIRLHLAADVMSLWETLEAAAADGQQPPPFWAFAWPGGLALARYLLDHPHLVADRTVLDFGAGSGVAGIAAALAGAQRVEAAEIDPIARAACVVNAADNGVRFDLFESDPLALTEPRWDVILAGDVCYERSVAHHITRWLRAQAARGVQVLLADPGRAYRPTDGVVECARYHVTVDAGVEGVTEREPVIWSLLPG